MRSFPGKIRFPEENAEDVAAVITVTDDRLELSTDDTPIGTWPIGELDLALGTRGYHVTLDGEELVLAPHDRFGFNDAVESAQQAALKTPRQRRKEAKAKAKAMAKKRSTAPASPAPVEAPDPVHNSTPAHEDQEQRAVDSKPAKAPRQKKVRKPKQPRVRRRRKAPVDPNGPKPVPHVPGLEDPDRDALWATHRTQEAVSWRERLNTKAGGRKVAIGGAVAFAVLVFFAPAVIALMLLIPGAVAVILAGLSMLDPSFTRFVPPAMTEVRLMVVGIAFFGASMLVAWIF